jgi:hypothetical protein
MPESHPCPVNEGRIMLNHIELARFIEQELSSVLVETNSIRLQFVQYPLSKSGEFKDSAIVEIEHGFEVLANKDAITAIYNEGAEMFRKKASALLQFIEDVVVAANLTTSNDLELVFKSGGVVRVLESDQGFDGFHIHLQSHGRKQ